MTETYTVKVTPIITDGFGIANLPLYKSDFIKELNLLVVKHNNYDCFYTIGGRIIK